MARPTPVFAFAFAAFAATCSKGSIDSRLEDSESPDASDLFLKIWRAAAPADGDFRVKIGVVDEAGRKSRLCDREAADLTPHGELWLGNIAETPRNFCGIVANMPDLPRLVRRGERISFELRHILGWTLGVNATKIATSELNFASPLAPSSKLLADLEIS